MVSGRALLPKMLPNRSRNASEGLINLRRCVVPELIRHMAINVERHGDGGVTESFLGDLRMYPGQEQLRRMCMSKGMEMNLKPEAVGDASEIIRQDVGQYGAAVRASANQRIAHLPNTKLQQLLGLL